MKLLYAVGVVALLLIILAISAIWADSTESVSAQVPACIVDGTPVPCPTNTAVPTATVTATPVPPTATPIVITNTVVTQCEGPYLNTAPYALNINFPGFVSGLQVYPWAGTFGWAVPTLVTRVNGQVQTAVPNAPACVAMSQVPTPVPTATTQPQQVVVIQQVPATPAPSQASQPAPTSMIRPPSTGNAGLLP